MKDVAYSLEEYVEDLRRITLTNHDEDKILDQVAPLAQRMALDKGWLKKKHYQTDPEQGFGVHLLHEEPDHSLAIFAIAWLPGRGAPPHDHGTWAVVAGVEGIETNTRYDRQDDRSDREFAKLSVKHQFDAAEGDLVCMKTGGIHAVHNNTDKITLSLHTYGKHINYTDRSQFHPQKNLKKDFIVKVN